jgi:RNA polymerase sigma-70 factor (ECF subfamily)
LKVLPPDTIKDLLVRVAEGDERAFRELFDRYHQQLGSFVLKLTRNADMAQDVVQDVFVKLWQQRASLPEVRNIETFLFVVSRNHVYDLLRKVLAERKRIERWASEVQHDESDGQLSDGLDEMHFSNLEAAVAKLPPQQQRVYRLKKQEGLKYKEIAELMGISPETVKKHMEAAVRNITSHLQNHIPVTALLLLIPLRF